MIENLTIKNFALIDSLSLDFGQGFTVLSGETGAGKSILIGSLSFLLGKKVSTEIIRSGAEEALVSGTFFISEKNGVREWLKERGLEIEDDRVIVRRNLKLNGRSSTWIQNTPVARSELEEFTSFLVDLHGQHDHQSLFKVSEHRRFLDVYAGIEDKVSSFTLLYAELADKKAKLEQLNLSEQEIKGKIEYLSFCVEEIESAKLKPTEEEELEAEESRLCQYEKLFEQVNAASQLLSDETGVISLLRKANHALDSAMGIDSALRDSSQRLESAFYELDDIAGSIGSYLSSLSFDQRSLDQIQERLSVIYKLKKKYGNSIREIQEYLETTKKQLISFSETETNKSSLEESIKKIGLQLYELGSALSRKRASSAALLQEKVEAILEHLGMKKNKFIVQVTAKEKNSSVQKIGPYGFDSIEFLISTNEGEPVKPLLKIASGGELSRVMLALKTVLAGADEVETLVFDEIDAGIGGEVALTVASHLKDLAKEKQILCITHLAIIAAHADNQVKIEKKTTNAVTRTSASVMSQDGRVHEIARMLAGDQLSTTSISHAKELLLKYSH